VATKQAVTVVHREKPVTEIFCTYKPVQDITQQW